MGCLYYVKVDEVVHIKTQKFDPKLTVFPSDDTSPHTMKGSTPKTRVLEFIANIFVSKLKHIITLIEYTGRFREKLLRGVGPLAMGDHANNELSW